MIQPWAHMARVADFEPPADTPQLAELRVLLPKLETSRLVVMIADPASELLPYLIDDESAKGSDEKIAIVGFVLVCHELDVRIRPRDLT